MHFTLEIGLIMALVALVDGQTLVDRCPKDEIACLDVVNGSQCLAQSIIDGRPPLTKANILKCVEHEGTASNLPGAEKVGCELWLMNQTANEISIADARGVILRQ